jgi:hypothetical protein
MATGAWLAISYQTRNQAASTLCAMPLSRDGNTAIRDPPVAFDNDIRLDFRMQQALDEVTLAGHAPPGVAHGLGGCDDFADVVGGVAESDEVNHGFAPLGAEGASTNLTL